ncbi:DinB family protein [Pedobacter yulinensis]|uniref:DinB family protein n=1 Tax=Pedobacter yulinensis TaxID=2126353 RepID=A0A2T3HMD1_9SPHI|nr:DinB family protein [Pedobacter yulinensis]PST83618.1 DinB family protein [Pedobacter yulinensis]
MQELQQKLAHSFQELLIQLDGLSQDQLDTVPFSGSWTASQLGQHLLKSYQVLSVLQGPLKPTTRPADAHVTELRRMFLDRDVKMQSPAELVPDARPIPKPELTGALQGITAQITHFAKTEDLQPTCLGFELPGFGALTRLEWLAFVQVHTQRHIGQLKQIISKISEQ